MTGHNAVPLVSVIIPVYNRVSLLKRALRSVALQTYDNLQIIVIDDASTEDIRQTVEGFGDKRMEYIRHDINMGPAKARNSGIKARGESSYHSLIPTTNTFPKRYKSRLTSFFRTHPVKISALSIAPC